MSAEGNEPLPRWVLFADTKHAATWIVAQHIGNSRYVEYARCTRSTADEILDRLNRSDP